MKIAGYQIREKLYEGKHFSIFRAAKETDVAAKIIKVLDKKAAPSSGVIASIKNEYYFLQMVDSEYVIKAVDSIEDKNYYTIVLEDINGRSLKEEIARKPLDIDRFIPLAVNISDGLAAIHSQSIIHRDINPTNIILDVTSGSLKIIDFSIASKYDVKVSNPGNPEELQGTLPYISPEQTGRMNRRVDQRSDLYSLGVTFYEMLTGVLPFRQSSPIELVYHHLARDPEPPHVVNRRVPVILAKIVLKLLAKNPEERYQSGIGLKHDLEKLQRLNLPEFTLGELDFPGKLQIPGKLYGREKEMAQLLSSYQAVSKGAKELILVTGYSGTGKTALVNEIHKPITRDRGYFISGKFDQLQRTIPYFALSQAFNQFCQLLQTEKPEILVQWKEQILQAVGKSGKVLTDTIPLLESIIGTQPEVPFVGGAEAKKRFNHVFQLFLRVVSRQEHPLVIFIDDLQWADLASLNLLQALMEDGQSQYLLFIGAYRDNEVSPTHPLMTTLEEIQKQEIALKNIHIKNLSLLCVRDWLGDTLRAGRNKPPGDIVSFSRLVYQKTEGNAFFTIQFLKNIYENNLLRFDFTQSQWTWDMKKIEEQHFTDNVVDLLVRKIQTLPTGAQEVLKLAACIGNVFDLPTLSVISREKKEEQMRHLEISLVHQLIYPLEDEKYRFVHDRIHQAAYWLISAKEKKSLHLRIGKLLLKNLELSKTPGISATSRETKRQVFDIVNHLNIGIDLIRVENEKIRLARLNLETGQNAKMSAAYKLGASYIHTALELLPGDCWEQYYELTLAIYNEAVQTSYLCGKYEEMESFVETVLKFAHNTADTSAAYEHRLRSLVAQNQPHRAVETLLTIFSSLGVDIPRKPGKLQTARILHKTHTLLQKKGIESLKDLPPMKDPQKQLVIKLFYMGGTALVWAGQDIFRYIIGTSFGFILRQGITPESPYVLCVYAAKRVFMGDIPGAYRLAEIIMDLLDKGIGNEAIRVSVVTIISIFILGNKQHFKNVCQLLMDTYQHALDIGNFDYASSILTNYLLFLSRTDMEIPKIYEKALSIRDSVIQLKQSLILSPILVNIRFNENLLGKHANPAVLDLDTDSLFQNTQEDTKKVFSCQANNRRIILAFMFEEYSHIIEYIKAAEDTWRQITSPLTFMKSDINFYIPLAYLQLYTRTAARSHRNRYLRKVKKSLKIMGELAEFGAVNFLHKYYLLQAELYRVKGKNKQASEYYEKAIEKAYENEYMNEAALATELAAKFYMQNNQHKLAGIYFQEARNGYRKWGAAAKVKNLDEKYPKYFAHGMSIPDSTLITHTISAVSTGGGGDFIDVRSILEASQTLSGEVQLKGLLKKMMQILIENAGAQKSVLIQDIDGRLLIGAEGSTEGVPGVLQGLPVEESEKIPLSVINYVAHSRQRLVFDNLAGDSNYSTDKYIQTHQPKSAVCFPILSKGALTAIIYLENNLVEGAFTPARLEILNMLSAQIAISVENTQLYEHLEEKVKQRTIALRQAHRELEKNHQALEESHKKINDSVNYASRIQEAVLPTPETLATILPRHFILYRPCSVVSGDFYWVKQVYHKIIAAAVDCTGHGVPGALVSMLGMAFLNEIVPRLASRSQLTAGNILNELRNEVKIALKQKGKLSKQKEGMDIALCIIDPINKQLQYAGAHNPLYIARDMQLIEVKADRMQIGISRKEKPFSNHDMPLQSKDMIYLFSDGYTDQNSEIGEEKFTKKRFKKLLLEINQEPLPRQKEILIKRFEEWKGNLPQRDDVLIFGIRF